MGLKNNFLNAAFDFTGELEHVLNHYETLHAEDVFHGVHKRDTYTALQEKIVSFTALGRQVGM